MPMVVVRLIGPDDLDLFPGAIGTRLALRQRLEWLAGLGSCPTLAGDFLPSFTLFLVGDLASHHPIDAHADQRPLTRGIRTAPGLPGQREALLLLGLLHAISRSPTLGWLTDRPSTSSPGRRLPPWSFCQRRTTRVIGPLIVQRRVVSVPLLRSLSRLA